MVRAVPSTDPAGRANQRIGAGIQSRRGDDEPPPAAIPHLLSPSITVMARC
jgi:hypothetical protein